MNIGDIIEFRTTWKNEFFFKNKSAFLTAKRLIKKSILIVQTRLCRQLKYTENDLIVELKSVQHDRQLFSNYYHSTSLAEGLQERLKVLQNEIENYNLQIKNLVKQEKQYWKQLEQIIVKRTNVPEVTANKLTSSQSSSNSRPIVVVNTTFVTHVDINNENVPPSEYKSPVKVPKIRKKKKIVT